MVHGALSAYRQVARRSVVAGVAAVPRYSPRDLPVPGRPPSGPPAPVRLTVLGCGPASPQPDTPASGLLVESGATAILLDCGQGVAASLVGLPGAGTADRGHRRPHARRPLHRPVGAPLPVRLGRAFGGAAAGPPATRRAARLAALAGVVSERDGFFDDAFDIREYDPHGSDRIGELEVEYVPGRHYVPAWGASLRSPGGTRIVYAGDTGPNPELAARASGAALLICEATLGTADEDDPGSRGHLSLDEAVDHAGAAGVDAAPGHPLPLGATRSDARPPGESRRDGRVRPTGPRRHPAGGRGRCAGRRTVGARAPRPPARTDRPPPREPGGRTSTTRRSTGPAPRCGRRRRSSGPPRSSPASSARRRPVRARAGPRQGSRRRPPGGR